MATNAPTSTQALEDLNKQHAAYLGGDTKAREAVVAAALKLVQELEHPGESIVRITWAQPCQHAAIQTAIDLDVFKDIEDGSPKNVAQLAQATSCDPLLMARVMRTISTIGFAREVDEDTYLSTPLTKAMATADYQAATKFMFNVCVPANLKTPEFLKGLKYQNPSHPLDTPFQYINNCKGEKHCFEIMGEMGALPAFGSMMKVWQKDRAHWSDEKAGFYPFTERLVNGANKGDDEPFLVDVGGGEGNDMLYLLKLHPKETLPGKLVLQDLPNVLDPLPAGTLPDHVEIVRHDFNTPQPIKGARVYFMHSIMHDYPDDVCKHILKQIAGAMEKGYSKVLLWDQVVPNIGAGSIVAAQDWEMMTFLSGAERTERQWRAVVEAPETGLKVTGIWYHSQYDQSIVEAKLA